MLLGAELVICVTDWLLRLLPSLVLRQFTTELLADARETHKMLLLIPRVNSRRESVLLPYIASKQACQVEKPSCSAINVNLE